MFEITGRFDKELPICPPLVYDITWIYLQCSQANSCMEYSHMIQKFGLSLPTCRSNIVSMLNIQWNLYKRGPISGGVGDILVCHFTNKLPL